MFSSLMDKISDVSNGSDLKLFYPTMKLSWNPRIGSKGKWGPGEQLVWALAERKFNKLWPPLNN